MSAAREAFVLPVLLLTAALLASVEPGTGRLAFVPPSTYSLVLASLLVAALARSGALDPLRLMSQSRSMLANANGAVILAALVAASGSVLTMITPRSGLPRFFVATFLLVLLVNTMVARPNRVRLLRSLAVILGSGVVIKFVILAGLSAPATSTTARVLIAVFDAATFGGIAQEPQSPAAGYLALAACALLLAAAALLPSSRRVELAAASRMQLPGA
jgi:hypothetical protein